MRLARHWVTQPIYSAPPDMLEFADDETGSLPTEHDKAEFEIMMQMFAVSN